MIIKHHTRAAFNYRTDNIRIKIVPILLLTLSIASISAASPSAQASEEVPVRRYLLSAGANNGGKGRVMLRYAVSDANMFASVLIDMGGVERNNALLLANPNVRELLGGVSNLNKLISADKAGAPGSRSEVFIYYSGHADETGLKLGGETLSWGDFRNAVDGVDSDVKVAVLDACGSGAITRAKGGIAQPVFMSDASSNMKGYAYLTSSNENEISQESDRIKGSFFTHALVSGMRGAADMTGNGRVTVNEAYTYAFNETLHNTQNTRSGTQHPSRDMNLTGTGDIVMTDLRQTSAALSLDADIEGRFFIWDASGQLFSELRKLRGRPIELGLPPGRYIVRMEAPSKMWSAGSVTVSDGEKTAITMTDMKPMGAKKRTTARGEGAAAGDDNVGGDSVGIVDDPIGNNVDNLEYLCGGVDDLPDDLAAICREELARGESAPLSSPNERSTQTAVSDNDKSSDKSDTAATTRLSLDSACAAPYRFNFNAVIKSDKPESGTQLSFVNNAMAEYCGTQTGMFNALHKDSRGVQVGIINSSKEYLDGTQVGVMNLAADTLRYVQAGYINIARDVGFVQGGAINIAHNVGFVQGGSVNIARDVGFVQGGSINIARNLQIQGGAVNIARDVEYVQAGSVNIARDVGKVQVGAINITGEAGRQIGVINISRYSEKTPIGLINIVGNGIIDVTALADATGDMGVSLRTGMPWLYTLLEYSQPEGVSEVWPKTFGWGLGTSFGMNGPVKLNLDLVSAIVYERDYYDLWKNTDWDDDESVDELNKYWFNRYDKIRFGASYSPVPYLAVTGGVSMNGHIETVGDADRWKKSKQWGSWRSKKFGDDRRFHAWPGLYAGLTVGKIRATKRESVE